jgi:hypothetical protein
MLGTQNILGVWTRNHTIEKGPMGCINIYRYTDAVVFVDVEVTALGINIIFMALCNLGSISKVCVLLRSFIGDILVADIIIVI